MTIRQYDHIVVQCPYDNMITLWFIKSCNNTITLTVEIRFVRTSIKLHMCDVPLAMATYLAAAGIDGI